MLRIASTVVCLLVLVPSVGSASDWPMHGGTPGRTSASSGPAVDSHWAYWRVETPDHIDLTSAVADGVVVTGGFPLVDSAPAAPVTARDATTGEQIWQTMVDGRVGVGPAIGGGKVLLTQRGALVALDFATGAPAWTYDFADVNADLTPPLVVGGRAVLAAHVADGNGGIERLVIAFDLATGTMDWQVVVATDQGGPVATDGERIYAPGVGLQAVDVDDGSAVWDVAVEYQLITVGDGRLYAFDMQGRVDAFAAATGAFLWTWNAGETLVEEAVYADGRLFVRGTGAMWALDGASGTELWEQAFAANLSMNHFVGAGGRLYLGAGIADNDDDGIDVVTGDLFAYDGASGALLWRGAIGLAYPMVVADGRLYASVVDVSVDSEGAVTGGIYFGAFGGPEPVDPDLLACEDDLAVCGDDLAACDDAFAVAEDDLATCSDALTAASDGALACAADLAAAEAALAVCDQDSAALAADLADAEAALAVCDQGLAALAADLADAEGDLALAEAALLECDQDAAALAADLAAAEAESLALAADLAAAEAESLALAADLAECLEGGGGPDALLAAGLDEIVAHLRTTMGDPHFELPGDTPAEQFDALVDGIRALEGGQGTLLYKRLGGTRRGH